MTAAIAGTSDDALYQSERYGNFSYNVPVANGDYVVTRKFAEIYFSSTGMRVFKVVVEEGRATLVDSAARWTLSGSARPSGHVGAYCSTMATAFSPGCPSSALQDEVLRPLWSMSG